MHTRNLCRRSPFAEFSNEGMKKMVAMVVVKAQRKMLESSRFSGEDDEERIFPVDEWTLQSDLL